MLFRSFDDHPFDVRAAKVEAEVAAGRWAVAHVGQVSPVTRVYAAATMTMIAPKTI